MGLDNKEIEQKVTPFMAQRKVDIELESVHFFNFSVRLASNATSAPRYVKALANANCRRVFSNTAAF